MYVDNEEVLENGTVFQISENYDFHFLFFLVSHGVVLALSFLSWVRLEREK